MDDVGGMVEPISQWRTVYENLLPLLAAATCGVSADVQAAWILLSPARAQLIPLPKKLLMTTL